MKRDFDNPRHVGEGWSRPRWKQVLLWLRYRPICWLRGEWVNLTTKTADYMRHDWGPFQRQWWIGLGDGSDEEWVHYVDQLRVHQPGSGCDCGAAYEPVLHHQVWERADDYRWAGDDWYRHDNRMYRFDRLPTLEDLTEDDTAGGSGA